MPNLNDFLQKLWAGMPGLVGLFLFLVTLGIFVGISVWEQASRRAEALRAERDRAGGTRPPPSDPEPARERAKAGTGAP